MTNDHLHGHDDHDHDHYHEHDHDEHQHAESGGWLRNLFHQHNHGENELVGDTVFTTSKQGIRALKISLVSLLLTALLQLLVVAASGSVALLADTIHNLADVSTAIPLWIAFRLNGRKAPRGFTYRYGKAEDLAGAFVVLVIAAVAALIFYETWQKITHPTPLRNLEWVAAAAIIGFIGNEIAAWVRIRTGKRIGSASLVADGMHARADGLTSLAVLVGAIGVALGFPLADPLISLLIGIAILFILRDAARTVWQRLMDAVDPALIDTLENTAAKTPGVQGIHDARLRWVGHNLWGELHIEVDGTLSTNDSHAIAENVRETLMNALPRLREMTVHVEPANEKA